MKPLSHMKLTNFVLDVPKTLFNTNALRRKIVYIEKMKKVEVQNLSLLALLFWSQNVSVFKVEYSFLPNWIIDKLFGLSSVVVALSCLLCPLSNKLWVLEHKFNFLKLILQKHKAWW